MGVGASSPDRSRLVPFTLGYTRLARSKTNREPVRRLFFGLKLGLDLEMQAALAPTKNSKEYPPFRATLPLPLKAKYSTCSIDNYRFCCQQQRNGKVACNLHKYDICPEQVCFLILLDILDIYPDWRDKRN